MQEKQQWASELPGEAAMGYPVKAQPQGSRPRTLLATDVPSEVWHVYLYSLYIWHGVIVCGERPHYL